MRLRGAVALVTSMLCVQPVGAQEVDDASVPLQPGPELEGLRLEEINARLDLEWRRDVDEIDAAGGSRRDVEDRLRQILGLDTRGFLGHPNLLELDLSGRIWFEQTWLDTTGLEEQELDQQLFEWDATGLLFKESSLPVTIYSRQNISDLDRQFGGTLENTFRENGARFNIRRDRTPINIHVYDRRISQVDTFVGERFDIRQRTLAGDGRIELGQGERLAWDVTYDDVEETGDLRVAQSFTRFEGNATHTLEFGETDQHSLRTRMRLFDRDGAQPLRQVRIDPRLLLRHSRTLRTWYDYRFARDDRPTFQQTSHRATANVQHQLFDSLTTIGSVGVDRFDIPTDEFESSEVFARLDTEYTKLVPYGELAGSLSGSFSRLDQSDRGAPVSIFDEVQTFNPSGLIVLDQRNILIDSIRITDATGVFLFSEGGDYSLLGFDDRVEIRRVPGGNIPDGATVRIDYVIGPDPGGETDTIGFGVELRYTFKEGFLNGLSVYGQYLRQWEDREILLDDFPENDFEDMRYGVEYNIWKLYLKAEQQHRRSRLSPFDALRLEGRYTEPLGRGSNLVLSAFYLEIDNLDAGIETATSTFSAQWNQQVDERIRFALRVQYQLTDDNVALDTEGFEQQLDVVWRYRQTEIYGQVRNSSNNTTANDTDLQRFIVGLRREF